MANMLADEISVEFRSNAAWNVSSLQLHDYYEVNLALMDAGKFFLEGKMYQLRKGTLFSISNSLLHRNISTDLGYERCVIKFMPALMQRYSTAQTDLLACFHAGVPVLQLEEAQIQYLLTLCHQMLEAKNAHQSGSDVYQQAVLIEMLVFLNQVSAMESTHVSADFSVSAGALSPILKYINDSITDPPSLAQIASRFFMSKSHLCVVFKKTIGITVNDYILHRRILIAKQKMSSALSLLEICNHCGFNSYTSFARCFKKVTGYSPKEYRATAGLIVKRD